MSAIVSPNHVSFLKAGDNTFCTCSPADSQRDIAQRPGSAYVTDEIWRKAGKETVARDIQ